MVRLQKILVPVDFEEASRRAVLYALDIADKFNGVVKLLHIWQPPHFVDPEAQLHIQGLTVQSLGDYARKSAQRQMDRFLKQFKGGDQVEQRIETGDPANVIANVAREENFDLIVMGTHGRTGLSHLLLGSVAEKVVRVAPCPVLTTHGDATPATKSVPVTTELAVGGA